ncbi:MAG: VCBS repeat-containing protein [Planctomycetota bacterium]
MIVTLLALAPALPQLDLPEDLTSTATFPDGLVLFDADADGDDDVVALSGLERRIVWFEALGAGAFGPSLTLVPVPVDARRLVGADFDGDGDTDLVIGGPPDDSLWVVENLGGGVFAAPRPSAPFGGSIGNFQLGDVDGDGDLDLIAITNGTTRRVNLFRNQGALDFAAPIDPTSLGSPSSQAAELADFTGDGVLDLVVMIGMSNPVTDDLILLRGDGAGGFSGSTLIESGSNLVALDSGDVDGDGDIDLATSRVNQNDSGVLLNLGSGAFGPYTRVGNAANYVIQVWLEDTDLDGDDDLLVERNPFASVVRHFESLGGGSFASSSVVFRDVLGALNHLQAADLNGDGAPDLAAAGWSPDGSFVAWAAGTGSGSPDPFEDAVELTAAVRNVAIVEAGDFDGDGDQDLIASGSEDDLTYFENTAPGTFERLRRIPIGGVRLRPFEVSDFDGDGLADLAGTEDLGTLVVRRNLGDLQFDASVQLAIDVRRIRRGDFDGDQDIDLAIGLDGPMGTGEVAWIENLGGFQWAPVDVLDATPFSFVSLQSADVDADGIDDLVAARRSATGSDLVWFRGTAQGPQGPLPLHVGPVGNVSVGDIDGDGRLDLASNSFLVGEALLWWRNLGGAAFAPAAPMGVDPNASDLVALFDVDGDGVLDVIYGTLGSFEQSLWARGLGGGTFAPTQLEVAPQGRVLHFADVDLDGDEDVLTTADFFDSVGLIRNLRLGDVGTPYCSNAVPNSTGSIGRTRLVGSPVAGENVLTLRASALPESSVGYFLNSQSPGNTFPVVASVGRLCLGGSIGRHRGPGEVQSSGTDGFFDLRLDLAAMPTPTGPMPALGGQTWYFQAWHRDAVAGQVVSNFTDAIEVLLQ